MPNFKLIICACVTAGDQLEESPSPTPPADEQPPGHIVVAPKASQPAQFEEEQEKVVAKQLDIPLQQLQQKIIEVHKLHTVSSPRPA